MECDEVICLLNTFFTFSGITISSEELLEIQILIGIGKNLKEISRLLHINNGKLFISVTAFKIIPQNIVPLWPLTVSQNRLSNLIVKHFGNNELVVYQQAMIISHLSSLTTCVSTSLRAPIRHNPLSEREGIDFRGGVDQIVKKIMLQAFSFRNVTRKCKTARQLCKYSGKLRKIIAAVFN